MIKPTIGRKVWYMPSLTERLDVIDRSVPLDATVVYVWNDREVNLSVIDHRGQIWPRHVVILLQDNDMAPIDRGYAMLEPGQTKKHETDKSVIDYEALPKAEDPSTLAAWGANV
jgi:hypothetical protein